MPTLAHDCPHCGTSNAGFILDFSKKCGLGTPTHAAIGLCGKCQGPALMEFISSDTARGDLINMNPQQFERYATLRNFYPEVPQPRLPAYTPEKILDVLREAEASKARKKAGVHGAGMAYGKVLDVATRAAGGKADTLNGRIKELGSTGAITTDLAEWMQTLRGVRNYATHDEEPMTAEEIEDLGEATQLLLQYIFTMPGMLKSIKELHAVKVAVAKA